jgi:hypothetical protein
MSTAPAFSSAALARRATLRGSMRTASRASSMSPRETRASKQGVFSARAPIHPALSSTACLVVWPRACALLSACADAHARPDTGWSCPRSQSTELQLVPSLPTQPCVAWKRCVPRIPRWRAARCVRVCGANGRCVRRGLWAHVCDTRQLQLRSCISVTRPRTRMRKATSSKQRLFSSNRWCVCACVQLPKPAAPASRLMRAHQI